MVIGIQKLNIFSYLFFSFFFFWFIVFLFRVAKQYFFMYVVGLLKAFQNTTIQTLPGKKKVLIVIARMI